MTLKGKPSTYGCDTGGHDKTSIPDKQRMKMGRHSSVLVTKVFKLPPRSQRQRVLSFLFACLLKVAITLPRSSTLNGVSIWRSMLFFCSSLSRLQFVFNALAVLPFIIHSLLNSYMFWLEADRAHKERSHDQYSVMLCPCDPPKCPSITH